MHVLGTGKASQLIKMVVQEAFCLEFKLHIPHKGERRKQTARALTFTNDSIAIYPFSVDKK